MAEERERPVEQASHLSKQLFDEFLQVGDRIFGDAAEPAGRLDCDHLDALVDELPPVSINGRASTGERKAKQPKSGSGPRARNDKPTASRMFGRDHDWLRLRFIMAGDQFGGDRPTAGRVFRLYQDRLRSGFIIGRRQVRQNVIRKLLDAGALNQLYGRNLDAKGRLQPVQERN